jgi:hypothetical protein
MSDSFLHHPIFAISQIATLVGAFSYEASMLLNLINDG